MEKKFWGPVLNAELWKQLIRNMKKIGVRVDIYYVKGHSKSKHNKEADKLAKKSANKCRNKQLSVVNLRRKLSNKSVLLGSVKMSGQKIKIRIISSSYLKTQRIKKYKYEVISKKSKFYKCVDQIYGDKNIKTLRVGHSYLVSLNKNNMYPQVSKVFCDITEKN